ncbi:MAG: hypothetical protein A2163_05745 [Actinobacteria bacterium RBG_13_35_12]|nr:MAG: hypothetical protein A2163_05745 [Actinobacteria bacterium RBG_13_35_12]
MEKNIPPKQSEFIIPKKFPSCIYSKISSIMYAKNQKYPQSFSEFSYAWLAVEYRFCTCFESNKNFTESFKKFGDGPPPSERYIQEKELFHFFVNGYSTLDCFGYALYMVASTIKPTLFPIEPSKLKHIYFANTCEKFNSIESDFQHEKIKDKLNLIKNSVEFKDWKIIRNALIHRISPGRTFHQQVGSITQRGKTTWNIDNKTFDIDECFTSSRFSWLEDSLISLLDAMLDFSSKSIQNYHLNNS